MFIQPAQSKENIEIANLQSKLLKGLLSGQLSLLDVQSLNGHNDLSAYAYTQLPEGHPERSNLRTAFLRATARHMSIKVDVLSLVRAWREQGIEVLIFKGFYLAQFVYPIPSQRFYGDVDVLIKPEQIIQARAIAKSMGWHEAWTREESLYPNNHEELRMDLPGKIRVEIHRYILDAHTPWDRLQRRFTEAAWKNSYEVGWDDTTIRVLHPTDSILMGLVLNRSWSGGDDWRLKSHDILDFKLLTERFALSQETLKVRARELNCSRTFHLFLKRCNPWEQKVDLLEPTSGQRQLWRLAVTPERGHLGLERFLINVFLRLPLIISGLRYLPEVLQVRRLQNLDQSKTDLLRQLDKEPDFVTQESSLREEEHIALGIKWGVRLLWPFRRDRCLPRALALFAAYRKRGYVVEFYSATKSDSNEQQRHAWVHLAGRRLEDLLNVEQCDVDEFIHHYPPCEGSCCTGRSS